MSIKELLFEVKALAYDTFAQIQFIQQEVGKQVEAANKDLEVLNQRLVEANEEIMRLSNILQEEERRAEEEKRIQAIGNALAEGMKSDDSQNVVEITTVIPDSEMKD